MIIFLKEHQINSIEELNEQIRVLQDQQNDLKSSIREKQIRMKEINRQRQAIRDYSRTKEVYAQFKESGWSTKFHQEHQQEIGDHKKAQAVYSSFGGKIPTLKELTEEYATLKAQSENEKATLAELKSKLTNPKHIRYNYDILERDVLPETKSRTQEKRIERQNTLNRMESNSL